MGMFAITGAGSGIGAATRARLERAGHTVVGIDLKNAEVIADLSTPTGRQAAVAAVLDASRGSLDGLLTAAGVGPPFDAEKMVSINWFGSEALLARFAGWHLTWKSPLGWVLRDALLPCVWVHAWLSHGYAWRGNEIRTVESGAQAG